MKSLQILHFSGTNHEIFIFILEDFKNNEIFYIPIESDPSSGTYTLWQMYLQSVQATSDNKTITSLNQLQQTYISIDTRTTYVRFDLIQSMVKSMNLYNPDNYDSVSGCYYIDCRYGRNTCCYQVQFSFLSDDNDTAIQIATFQYAHQQTTTTLSWVTLSYAQCIRYSIWRITVWDLLHH